MTAVTPADHDCNILYHILFFFIKKASISSITQYFHSLGKVENVFPSIWTLIDGPFGTGQPRGTKAQGQTEKLGHFRVASSVCFTAVSDNTRPAMSKRLWILGFSVTSVKIWRLGAFMYVFWLCALIVSREELFFDVLLCDVNFS